MLFLGASTTLVTCFAFGCGQRSTRSPPSATASSCTVTDAPRPPGAPCSAAVLAAVVPDLYDDSTGATCKQQTQLYGAPAFPSEPSGRELVEAFGTRRELVFCGGDAALAALGWTQKSIRLSYAPGEREVITRCPGSEPRMSIELGSIGVESVGSETLISPADFEANLKSPYLVRVFSANLGTKCNLQLTAWARGGEAEACLSLRGKQGELLYASFRTRCGDF